MSAAAEMPERTPCERCGDYAELVDYDGHRICEDCIGRLSEIERTPPTIANVLSGAGTVLLRVGFPAAVLVSILDLPLTLAETFLPEMPMFVSSLWSATVSILGQGAVLWMAHRAIRGERVDGIEALRRAADVWTRLVVTNFLAGIQIFLFTLLLIVPGVVRALSLAIALPIALHEEPDSALRESTRRMKGHRAVAFVAYLIWGLAWLLAVGASMVVYVGADLAYFEMADAELVGVSLLIGILFPVLTVPLTCTSAVLYAKTLKYRVY